MRSVLILAVLAGGAGIDVGRAVEVVAPRGKATAVDAVDAARARRGGEGVARLWRPAEGGDPAGFERFVKAPGAPSPAAPVNEATVVLSPF